MAENDKKKPTPPEAPANEPSLPDAGAFSEPVSTPRSSVAEADDAKRLATLIEENATLRSRTKALESLLDEVDRRERDRSARKPGGAKVPKAKQNIHGARRYVPGDTLAESDVPGLEVGVDFEWVEV